MKNGKYERSMIFWDDICKWYDSKDLKSNYFYKVLEKAIILGEVLLGQSTPEYHPVKKEVKQTNLYTTFKSQLDNNLIQDGEKYPDKGLIATYSGKRNFFYVRIYARRTKDKSIRVLEWGGAEKDPKIVSLEYIEKHIGKCKGYSNYEKFLKDNFQLINEKNGLFEVDRCIIERPEVMSEWVNIMLKLSND